MNNVGFEAMVELKIRHLIELIVERERLNFESAITYLYTSTLYNLLVEEDSKLWHLSDEKLFTMLIEEKEHNQLILPDYV